MFRLAFILICLFCCLSAEAQKRRGGARRDTVEFGSEVVKVEKVEVKAKRVQRYSKKDNPAVTLARRLIATRDSLDVMRATDQLFYDRYEKIVISLNDFKPIDSTKSFAFLNEHSMINQHTGKRILPISLREKLVATTRHRSPKKESHVTIFDRSDGVDDRFSSGTVLAFLNDAIPEMNIFADNIYLVQRQLMSPLSTAAVGFYKFYLRPDTIVFAGERCVELEFFPFSKNSLSLRGRLIVSADSSEIPFIHYAQLSMPNSADINYMSNFVAEQSFVRDSGARRLIVKDEVNFDFSPVKPLSVLNITRTNQFSSYSVVDPSLFAADSLSPHHIARDTSKFSSTEQERLVSKLAKRMRSRPLYAIAEEIVLICTDGYLRTGKRGWFDIGPIAQFLSGNTLEGTRLALGAMTTPFMSKHFFVEGLFAYGIGDNRFKYNVSVEWSFIKRKEHIREFPIHSIRATYSYDVHRFGERLDKLNIESIFSWAKRSSDYNLTYVRLAELRYMREFESNFSFSLFARHYTQYETKVMSFAPTAGALPYFSMAEAEIRLRYAPGEKIYETRLQRLRLNKYAPAFELSHVSGFKGVLGGNYTRNFTQLEGLGRINLQPIGYLDFYASVGAEWNEVPYMLLPHPHTNMSYLTTNDRSFSLMRPLEFIYDKYLFVGLTYFMDGLIFSRIPLIKHLNLREVFTFRGVYGHLSDHNNPAINSSILPFPAGSAPIGREPYIEVGVGIDNILSFFRLDYVWRLTYLNGVNVESGAILFNFQIKF